MTFAPSVRQKTIRLLLLCLVLCTTLFCREQSSNYQNLLSAPEDAEFLWDTRFIDFGGPSAQKFLKQGWAQNQSSTETTVAVTAAPKASISFYSLHGVDKELKVRCRTSNGSRQIVVPSINGTRLKAQKVGGAFKEYTWPVDRTILRNGINELTFLIRKADAQENGSAIDFDYLTIHERQSLLTAQQLAAQEKRLAKLVATRVKNGSHEIQSMIGPAPSSISMYAEIPADSEITIQYGIVRTPNSKGSGARFTVFLEDQQGNSHKIGSEVLSYSFLSGSTGSQKIKSGEFANQMVRLTLEAFADQDADKIPEQIYWQSFLVPSRKTNAKEPEPFGSASSSKPNIFFYLIDAARADHFQAYGYSRETSPRIQQFTRDSVVFENAYSHSSWTRPAVASIVTGLYPSSHGTVDRVDMLAESTPTLQALLKQNGYHNYGFTAQPNVGTTFRFERNFDVYRLIKKDEQRQAQSDRVHQELREFLKNRVKEPAFFYIHVIDPHRPYLPLPEFESKFGSCREEDSDTRTDNEKRDCAMAQYDSLILQSDHYFGKFIDLLKQQKLYDDSLIVLTADHGESFWEHGEFGHGKSLYEPEIRVPLVIHFPQAKFGGKRVSKIARHIDLFATILEAAGIRSKTAPDARSLGGLLSNAEPVARPVFSELSLDGRREKAFIYRDYKLIAKGEKPNVRYQLFHLAKDPGEKINIAAQEPIVFGYLKRRLNELQRASVGAKAEKAVLDKETEEMLKGLGYLQ